MQRSGGADLTGQVNLWHVHWVSECIHKFSDVLFSLGYIEMCAVYFYFNTDLKSVELQEYL